MTDGFFADREYVVSKLTRGLLALTLCATLCGGMMPRSFVALGLTLVLGIVTAFGIGYAVHTYRPAQSLLVNARHPDPWIFLAGSFVVQQIARLLQTHKPALSSPPTTTFSWIATAATLGLAGYGLILMLRHRYGDRARDHVSEALILSGTCSLLMWVTIIEPIVNAHHHTFRSIAPHAITLSSSLILAALATYVAASFDKRHAAFTYLAVANVLPVLASIFDLLGTFGNSQNMANVASALVPLAIGFAAIGALEPSMALFEEPSGPAGARLNRWRFANLLAPVVLGPTLFVLVLTNKLVLSPSAISIYTIGLSIFVVGHLLAMVQARASSSHWASHDKLTGLPNRALFRERTAQSLERARKFNHAVAVMYLDLDRFKHVNDSMGHAAGDQLLEQVARRILTCVDQSDTVARLGGDEFAILLPSIEDDRVPRMLARRLLKAFSSPFNLKPRPVFTSPSIGISVSDASIALETLLMQADTAMYRAKESGRNNFAVWTHEMNEASHQRLLLETNLHTAIVNDELRLVYQPKVNMSTGKIVGVEALVRWHHPKLGVISPAIFIHLAEESGLINQIGEWVLNTACQQAHEWYENGYYGIGMAVNLSSRQFQNQNIADLVAHTLRSTQLDPRLLELELTESLAMSGEESTVNTLLELRGMGVTTAIDDFGTGYSNLSYLSRFPIDKLKIDRAFIELIDKSGGDAAIVVAIIAMAHGLGLKVIAEGVETPEQADFLAAHACDEMQGFLFSKPLPPEQLERLLMHDRDINGTATRPKFPLPPPGLSGQPRRIEREMPSRERAQPQIAWREQFEDANDSSNAPDDKKRSARHFASDEPSRRST